MFFLVIFVVLNQLVSVFVAKQLPALGSVMQALLIWVIEVPVLLFLLLPVYCMLLRREIRKKSK